MLLCLSQLSIKIQKKRLKTKVSIAFQTYVLSTYSSSYLRHAISSRYLPFRAAHRAILSRYLLITLSAFSGCSSRYLRGWLIINPLVSDGERIRRVRMAVKRRWWVCSLIFMVDFIASTAEEYCKWSASMSEIIKCEWYGLPQGSKLLSTQSCFASHVPNPVYYRDQQAVLGSLLRIQVFFAWSVNFTTPNFRDCTENKTILPK